MEMSLGLRRRVANLLPSSNKDLEKSQLTSKRWVPNPAKEKNRGAKIGVLQMHGLHNYLNVLHRSLLLGTLYACQAPHCNYVAYGHGYNVCYTLHMTPILNGPNVGRQFNFHKVTRTLTLQCAKNPWEIMSTTFGVLQACFMIFHGLFEYWNPKILWLIIDNMCHLAQHN